MIHIPTPHIAVGSSMAEALEILRRLGHVVQEASERELSYRVETPIFAIAVYPKSGTVGSVWYDDPTGRTSETGRSEKVDAYLSRYGPLENWERRLDNGCMHYWFNPTDGAQMVYGIHKDVIRFNQYSEEGAELRA
jgi:hypothetical protein